MTKEMLQNRIFKDLEEIKDLEENVSNHLTG